MSKGNNKNDNVKANTENWREPASKDDNWQDEFVGVVQFDSDSTLKIEAHTKRNFENPEGIKIKVESEEQR